MGIFKLKTIENKSILTVDESIYPDNGEEFGKILENAAKEGIKVIIIDLSKVSIVYSSGITELIKACTSARAKNVKLILVGVQENVMKIFKLCGFEKLFNFASTLEDAMKG